MHARGQAGNFGAVGKAQGFHLVPGERGNGDANILQRLFPLLGGHDNLFQDALGLNTGRDGEPRRRQDE
ncbi:hypothetical protein D3C83_113360 [compost metagenome]